jgi:predicted Zn-dependent protease
MMNRILIVGVMMGAVLAAAPARAQLGGIGKALDRVQQVKDFVITEAEERQMGSEISTKLRNKYGVVQDRAVHRYVTLVGRVLADGSSRPNLGWTFIVLDTDGVNAFAAPGGFIHITRGALALITNEAELADVLAHEIIHVTEKHTLKAIQKSKIAGAAASASRSEILNELTDLGYNAVLENNFDRGDETGADKAGITLANKAGYAPTGLAAFLTRLSERNKGLKERSGMFASHPESKARTDALAKVISGSKLTASALVATRYGSTITFKPVPIGAVSQVAATTPAASAKPTESSEGGKFGMSGLRSLGRDKSSGDTVSSAGSRGVNPDRDAAGGPVKTLISVTVSAAEIAEFRKGISG